MGQQVDWQFGALGLGLRAEKLIGVHGDRRLQGLGLKSQWANFGL